MSKGKTMFQQFSEVTQRINQIVAGRDLGNLFDQILDLIMGVTDSQAAVLYLYDATSEDLILQAVQGSTSFQNTLGSHVPVDQGAILDTLRLGLPVFVSDVSTMMPPLQGINGTAPDPPLRTMYCIPLMLGDQPVGVAQVFNPSNVDRTEQLEFLHLLGMLLAPHIEKAQRLSDEQRRARRFRSLIGIMAHLSTTLERDQLLDDIMTYVQELLEVEATSIWIKDEHHGDLVLHIATGERSDQLREVRVPAEQGIIGYVVSSGKSVVVNDVLQNSHFYRGVDQQSGFTTRSIMCVPLRASEIQLGGRRGELKETIIGGAQALNKRDGSPFNDEDKVLFQMLANQAATILQLSDLYGELSRLNLELMHSYNETRKMFRGFINGITSFIDRKDPYTRGHSQRVADFSVAIARELSRANKIVLSEEMLHHIHIGGILHDVGKIGVSDDVLKKPGRLTDDEMDQMKCHPVYGIELLEDADLLRLLPIERQAIEEHHERLDGNGYPRGKKGIRRDAAEIRDDTDPDAEENNEQGISLIGRIVAVADIFDALTSDRPYRKAMSAEEVLDILLDSVGKALDPMCVEALVQARKNGRIKVQCEREAEHLPLKQLEEQEMLW